MKRLPVVPPPVTDDDADRRQVDELLSVWNRTSRSARSIFLEAVGASGVRSAA
jgi:hypothetical protein